MGNFKTTEIKFTSRSSIKLKENYFTFEATITKQCPENYTDEEYNEAKQQLWDECNNEIDKQVIEIQEYLKNKR